MAKKDLNIIKNWFKTGLFPTQAQFWDTWDSFFHKDDTIPASQVENLQDLLDQKIDKKDLPDGADVGIDDVSGLRTELDDRVNKIAGKGLSSRDYTPDEKNKLATVEQNANNYQHPATHPASVIDESVEQQFVAAADKISWYDALAKVNAILANATADGDTLRKLFDLIQALKGNAPEAGNSLEKVYNLITGITNADNEYPDIASRDADKANLDNGESVIVTDATADPMVVNGWAIYRFNKTTQTFLKIAEQESIDIDLSQYMKSTDLSIADNLTTVAGGEVLDARQGKILKDLIYQLSTIDLKSLVTGNTIEVSRSNRLKVPGLFRAFDPTVKFLEDFDYDIELLGSGAGAYPRLILRNANDNQNGYPSKDIPVITKNGIRYLTVTDTSIQVTERGKYCYSVVTGRFRDHMVGTNLGGTGSGLGGLFWPDGSMYDIVSVDVTDDNPHPIMMVRFYAPLEGQEWDLSTMTIYPYWKKALATVDEMQEYNAWYGVEWDSATGSPDCARIGNIKHHQSLPIQSKMRRCLVWDNGTVHYYLDAVNSANKEDGTPAVLDGTHGQVMVEVPEFYYCHELDGTKHRYKISEKSISGYKRIKKFYISAYEASLQRSTNKLSSVINADPDYRGGNNTSSWDATSKSLCGKPVTNLTRNECRVAASTRGVRWHQQTAYEYYPLSMLFVIEYATFNSQKAIDIALENGMRKGGLGSGLTEAGSTEWSNFNSYNPVASCGLTNVLGNRSGDASCFVPDFGGDGVYRNFRVNSYRGVENPFGHIWKFLDGLNINEFAAYATDDVSSLSDDVINGYEMVGLMPAVNGYQTDIQNHLLPLPKAVGGGSTTHLCDYYYQASSWRVALVGGSLLNGSSAGLFVLYVSYSSSVRDATIGARLCLRDE